jgi:hypothetical protein
MTRANYFKEWAQKNKERRRAIEKRSREKRKLKAQALVEAQAVTDDECFLEPAPEGWERGRVCRECGVRVVPTSYYYCAFHYYAKAEEHIVYYGTAESIAD